MSQDENKESVGKRKIRRFGWWMLKFVFITLLSITVLLSVFQLPGVQRYIKDAVIETIQQKTGSKITFDHLAVSIWNGITLENFKVIEADNTSLFEIGKLGFSLRKNLLYLFNRELDISTLKLEDINLNIVTRYMESESNISRFLKNLSLNANDGSKQQFLLSVQEIFLRNISVIIDNENKGTHEDVWIDSGLIELEKLDLGALDFKINQLYLQQPSYRKSILNESCHIEDELTVNQLESDTMPTLALPFCLQIISIEIEKGSFGIFNHTIPVDKKFMDVMDFNHFVWSDIEVDIRDVAVEKDYTLTAVCKAISFSTDRGFNLNKFSVDTITFTNEQARFSNVSLTTDETEFKSNLVLNYYGFEAFKNFKEEVYFTMNVEPSLIHMLDISHFVKGMVTNPVTQGINDKPLFLAGTYYGKFNGINGKKVRINLDDKIKFGGSFSTNNLDDYNNTLLNIRLDNFTASMRQIKKLFPTFNIPENFYKLGNIRFNGQYDGYLEDFVAYGKIQTDLGSIDLDMRLDITGGVNKALYSGKLNLNDFNLAKWSDNPDFGLVYFTSKVKKGQGLTLQTLSSDLEAVVTSLTYKGYEYKGFNVNGIFEKNNFKGSFRINDPNIDVKFDGNAEFISNQSFLNFTSTIKNLDLYALHLSKQPFQIKGLLSINASGSNINDVLGNIEAKNIEIRAKDTSFMVNDVSLSSKNLAEGGKEIKVLSELGKFQLTGDYDLNNIGPLLVDILKSNYPSITRNWQVNHKPVRSVNKMDFDIELFDSKHFLMLAGLDSVRIFDLQLRGKIDGNHNEISMASNIPKITIKKDTINNIQVLVSSYKNSGDVLVHVKSGNIFGKPIGTLDFSARSQTDSILFNVSSSELVKSVNPLDISGSMTPFKDGYSFSLGANKLNFLGKDWSFSPKNKISITKDYLNIDNFELFDGFRKIYLEDDDNRGLELALENFDLDLLNLVLKDKRFILSGLSKVKVNIEDIFAKNKEIYATVNIPEFYINKDPYGNIDMSLEMDEKKKAKVDLLLGEFFTAKATLDLEKKIIQGKARLKDAPLKILEYILAKGIQNTQGVVDAQVDIGGGFKDFEFKGEGTVHEGQTKIIYTGVTYYFDNQKFTISEKNIDFTGAEITDARNNPATVTGGLYHDRFKKFGVNAVISGENVIGLQTTLADNQDYYGFAIGQIRASFTGSFEKVDMVIDGLTKAGTSLSIPVGNTSGSKQNSTIRFEKRSLNQDSILNIANKVLKGIDLEMNLTLTPDASISIIFDADKGDIISGVGRGNLQIFVKRTGAFDIFGDYEIESGNYLFTVAQLPVAKPFVVYRGGTIRWTGDPVNTTLNIQAVYKSRTSLRPFIEEYLGFASEQLVNQANQRQDVDVILNLGGTLYQPDVSFNLAFPNLVGQLSTLADSKLRVLQTNQLELNSQVFGLIMFNNFLPSNRVSDVLGYGGIQTIGINTLSEFLSSQLSLYITNLINLALVENGLLAGVDFEIGVRNNTGGVSNLTNNNVWPDEIQFRLKNRFKFLDERVTLNMGGNYIFENQGLTYNQMLPDFSLELILTEDRKLKARIYGRQELIVQNTLSPKVGVGLAYRTEFGTLTSFEDSLKATIQKAIRQK